MRPPAHHTSPDPHYSTKVLRLDELTESDVAAWKNLESFATEANAYLSPNFVIPAARYLEHRDSVFVLLIHKNTLGSSELVGIFIFKLSKFSKLFPLPHLVAYHSQHSYLTGALVAKDHTENIIEILFNYFSKFSHQWHGIVFEEHPAQGPLADLENNISADLNMRWVSFEQWDRSVLYPAELHEDLPAFISKKLQKNFRRNIRGFAELGDLEWKLISGGEVSDSNIDNFIRLEHMGWKGNRKSSLYSRPDHTSFFREMIGNFNRDGTAFFTELRLNGQTIASTSNIISGNNGFAFKIGWDPDYAKYSPGIQNELMLLICQDQAFKQLNYIDSGSAQDSYINTIWPGKRRIQTGVYLNSNIGKLLAPAIHRGWYPGLRFAKKTKQRIQGEI